MGLESENDEEVEISVAEAKAVMGRLRYFLGYAMAMVTDAPNVEVAAWQVSFALGTDNCIGHTMTSKAEELGVGVACISKGATKICRALELPPSPYMLPKAAQNSYRELRRKQEAERAKR